MTSKTTCEFCRYWSEMLAQSIGHGPIEAVCLAPNGPKHGKYMPSNGTCASWADGYLGGIDSPGFAGHEYDLSEGQP